MENRISAAHAAGMDERLALFVTGSVDDVEQDEIARHSTVCCVCAERLSYWQELLGVVSMEPPAGHRGRFLDKLGKTMPMRVAATASRIKYLEEI